MWIEFRYMLKLKISFEINCKETTADKVKWLCYHIWNWLWFCISNHCHDDININIYVTLEIAEGNGTPLQYFAWKIPWMEEPSRLQSMGSLRVGHNWVTSLSFFTFMHWRRKWQPTAVFFPGESQGRGSLVAAVYGVTQNRTRLKWLSSSSNRDWVHSN